MMGVHPDAQRQGVGRVLMEYILTWLDQQQCPTILLDATVDGAALYTHFGFVDAGQVIHWQRPTDALADIPQPLSFANTVSQTRPALVHQGDTPAIVQFDIPFFGTDRTSVLQLFLSIYTGRAFFTRGVDNQITGYIIAQKNALGAWVASKQQDAEVLLRQALTLPFQQHITVLASTTNTEASSLLEHYGFTCIRTLRHMRRGQPAALRRRDAIYGQISFALG